MASSKPGLLLLFFTLVVLTSALRSSASSFSQLPFLTVWNAPTASCLSRHDVDLDLGTFSIAHNQNETFMGENITIFYKDKLGLYPSYSGQAQPVNGGVPQNASLARHLSVARENIQTCIPDEAFGGLAVVDWESWRPVWERNWDSKEVYWRASRELVRAEHPDWSQGRVDAAAKQEFESSARKFMEETLRLAQGQRPSGLWGYYGFPDCYNSYKENDANYTGECPAREMKRNEQLLWLWNASSALYPDIYLNLLFRGLDREVYLYAHHRLLEALRVGALLGPRAPPVFPYSRIAYTYTLDFLSQEHLVYTIGESAALGAAGTVLWGDHAFANSKATCESVHFFIEETLGFYLVNVTAAATLCSNMLCSSQGRCQRRDPESRAYLHLDPKAWKITVEKGRLGRRNYKVLGQMSARNAVFLKSEFRCQCYQGRAGKRCSKAV